MSEETCFIPVTESSSDSFSPQRPTANSYSFITEIFFLTHRALDLGFRVCSERLVRLNQVS